LYFTELSYIVNGEVEISNYNNYDQQNRCKVFEEKMLTDFLMWDREWNMRMEKINVRGKYNNLALHQIIYGLSYEGWWDGEKCIIHIEEW
jgi:hypothetical protein